MKTHGLVRLFVSTGQRGFTLIELLVAMVAIVGVLAGAVLALEVGLLTVQTSGARAESQSNARMALQRMVPDIRTAGYDPTGVNFPVVINQGATSVTLQSDRNANSIIDPLGAGACDPAAPSEVVRYSLVGTELRRSVNPAVGSCEAPVIGGVQALNFSYLDAGGNATAVSADIRTIVVSITARPETPGYNSQQPSTVVVTDQVRLRNR
jgi:prepilin-type N-terminal cleavage/methylation domain-containing protein